jgi:hypothetical protein
MMGKNKFDWKVAIIFGLILWCLVLTYFVFIAKSTFTANSIEVRNCVVQQFAFQSENRMNEYTKNKTYSCNSIANADGFWLCQIADCSINPDLK